MPHRTMRIDLTPEQHRALQQAARAAGRPTADLVRELIERHIMHDGPSATNLDDLASAVRLGRPTDMAAERDHMLVDVVQR